MKRIAACRLDDFLSCRRFWATTIDSGFKNNRPSTRVGPVTTDVTKGLFFSVFDCSNGKTFFTRFALVKIDEEARLRQQCLLCWKKAKLCEFRPRTDLITHAWKLDVSWRDVINSFLTSWIRFIDALLVYDFITRATCIIVPIFLFFVVIRDSLTEIYLETFWFTNILEIYNQSIFKFYLPKILNSEKS